MEKYKRSLQKINSTYQFQHGMNIFSSLMDHILYEIFSYFFKYICKIKIKTGYYVKLLTFETIKLLGTTKTR